jgi:hypothetical protein
MRRTHLQFPAKRYIHGNYTTAAPGPEPMSGGAAEEMGEIEVRQFFELEDFGPSEAVDRSRRWRHEQGAGAP